MRARATLALTTIGLLAAPATLAAPGPQATSAARPQVAAARPGSHATAAALAAVRLRAAAAPLDTSAGLAAARPRTAAATRSRATPAALAASPPRVARILSADARLRGGHSAVVLVVPRVGRWTATCAGGAVSVRFTADRRLATSDLVVALDAGEPLGRRLDPGDTVTPQPPAAVLAQRWQIAPFAAAQVHVTAATVAARRVSAQECAASVVAVIGPDQGATRTG